MLPIRDPIIPLVACAVPVLLLLAASNGARAAELLVGGATTSITPDKPVALAGQFHTRIARTVETPVTATALALETRSGGKSLDQAIVVSCDLAAIRGTIQDQLRQRLKDSMPGFDLRKLFLTATHTHTAPVMLEGTYEIPKKGVMQPSEYVEFLLGRLSEVAAKAWEARKPGGVSWGLGHAAVGYNRRVVYENGTARMYGSTNTPDLRSIEGYQDHGVDMLFFWNGDKQLIAVAINVACPSQEVEGRSAINADFWHDVREQLHKRYAKDLYVLGWCGAAGDQSPHLLYGKAADERMRRLRGLTRMQEIARRITQAVDDVFELAKADIRTDVPLAHKVQDIKLPRRRVTDQEFAQAKAEYEQLSKKTKLGPQDAMRMVRAKGVMDRHGRQDAEPDYQMELHVVRLGDVGIATNPFELFLDFGIQIKARSKAVQTFVIQLAGTYGGYVPTEKAVRGGHYSTEIASNIVGPEGGKVLANRTVQAINALWRGGR